MKLKRLFCISPALAGIALSLSSCTVTDTGGYYSGGGGTAVSTDFVLSYTTGYAGTGYYYGPRGYNYSRRGPGVYYYRTRDVVPSTYWGHWHGDSRYYGGPAGRYDRGHDGHRDGRGRYDNDRDGRGRYDNNDRDGRGRYDNDRDGRGRYDNDRDGRYRRY